MTDPTVAELLRALHELEAAFGSVREELVRQDERTKGALRGLTELQERVQDFQAALGRRIDALRSEDIKLLNQRLGALRSDVDQLLTVVKPEDMPGLLQAHNTLKDRVLRMVYGTAGVLFIIAMMAGMVGLYLKLRDAFG